MVRAHADYGPNPLDRIPTCFDQHNLAADRCHTVAGEVCLRRPISKWEGAIG